MLNRLISIAPMMDCTDRHDRYFLRLISPHVLLYTEMLTTGALLYGDAKKFLAYDMSEHPLALQLGGSEPDKLALCARMGEDAGYDEINLNVGCPSDRVKSGRFGACLMLSPHVVAECVAAMNAVVNIPVTVKCRIGVDDHDSYEELTDFIKIVSNAGCTVFIVHARKAWLTGLSPKENRDVPPLCYETVWRLKKDFPHLTMIINGGIKTVADIDVQLSNVDGVMIGREAYSNPYLLADIENRYYASDTEVNTRQQIVEKFIPYVSEQLKNNVRLSSMTRHILGLFMGQQGARIWRRTLSENAHKQGMNATLIHDALQAVRG